MDSSAAITPTPKPSHTGLPADRLPANFHQPRPEHLHQRAASTQRRQRGALGVFPKAWVWRFIPQKYGIGLDPSPYVYTYMYIYIHNTYIRVCIYIYGNHCPNSSGHSTEGRYQKQHCESAKPCPGICLSKRLDVCSVAGHTLKVQLVGVLLLFGRVSHI